MSIPTGTYLGAVLDLETLRGRCVVDRDTGCWHLRSASGRRLRRAAKETPKVYVHERGKVSARRAALEFARGSELPAGYVATACRKAWDCVNAAHVRAMHRKVHGQRMRATGAAKSAVKTASNRRTAQGRSRLTQELARWAIESPQTQFDIAHGLGCSQQRVSDILTGKSWRSPDVLPSVFTWRPA